MKTIFLLVSVFLLVACSAVAAPASEFDQAREKWQEAGISHYRFDLNIGCFCAFSQDMPLSIEVQDGEVVSMEYRSGNEIDPVNMEFFERFETIDKIFEELEKALDGDSDKVTVTYDETNGFPAEVSIDYMELAADDEIYLTISNFEALP